MAIPTIFTQQGGEKIATYDFYDLAEGTGIVTLYGYAIDTGAGTKAYRLTTNSSINSAAGTNSLTFGQTLYTKAGGSAGSDEVNFDLTFNKPQNIKGKVQLNVQCSISLVNPGSTLAVTAQLLKWNGSTETEISSAITSETITAVSGSDNPFFAIEVPLTALTHFKAGETLRIEIITTYSLSASSTTYTLYHSPTNQVGETGNQTDRFIALVPFVIE